MMQSGVPISSNPNFLFLEWNCFHESWSFSSKFKSPNCTSARARQLEFFDRERKYVIFGIVNQKAVEDVLLDAFGIVAGWNQWAESANNHVTFFNSSGLGVFDAVRLDSIDDGPPFAFDVNGPKRTNVIGGARTKVKFIA